jgi:hypothetical protein
MGLRWQLSVEEELLARREVGMTIISSLTTRHATTSSLIPSAKQTYQASSELNEPRESGYKTLDRSIGFEILEFVGYEERTRGSNWAFIAFILLLIHDSRSLTACGTGKHSLGCASPLV